MRSIMENVFSCIVYFYIVIHISLKLDSTAKNVALTPQKLKVTLGLLKIFNEVCFSVVMSSKCHWHRQKFGGATATARKLYGFLVFSRETVILRLCAIDKSTDKEEQQTNQEEGNKVLLQNILRYKFFIRNYQFTRLIVNESWSNCVKRFLGMCLLRRDSPTNKRFVVNLKPLTLLSFFK